MVDKTCRIHPFKSYHDGRLSKSTLVFKWPFYFDTVKPVLSGHSKRQNKILMANGSLIKVEGIAECSPWPALHDNRS